MDITKAQYVIVDSHTGLQIGKPYNNRKRARSRVDRLDNEYGAYRYRAVPLETFLKRGQK